MGLRERFEKKVREKEQEIQVYQQEIQERQVKIAEANIYIQAVQDSMRLLPREGRDDIRSHKTPSPKKGVMKPGSDPYKTAQFLREQGKPIQILSILEGIGKTPTKENLYALAGTLGAYVRKGEVFTRPAPNTFGLREWNQDQLPEKFGRLDEDSEKEEAE